MHIANGLRAMLWALAAARACPASAGRAAELPAEIRVDCSRSAGAIRPLHGVNNGPLNCGETIDVSTQYKELAVPLARLHDSEFPDPDVVDMHAVFPDLRADPEKPESYRFALTDTYIEAIVKAGTGIVYRLGESIEHRPKKRFVIPPADFDRWAGASIGIIRHYNDGWAGGSRYAIRYWEIWNEPENRPAMWTGSDDDYYRLYATAAKAIKARFPDLKVGGPAVGATGDVVDAELRATPFLEGLLKCSRERGAPLDFFSWHTYTNDPSLYVVKARAVRRWLDANGFAAAESHLNEWNYLPDNDWTPLLGADRGRERERWYARMGGAEGAAFVACVLAHLQDSPVDVANLYSGDSSPFGLFTRHGMPKKSFYAVKAFRGLLETPRRVAADVASADGFGADGAAPCAIAACAGTNAEKSQVNVLVSNLRASGEATTIVVDAIPWEGPRHFRVLRLDAERDLETVAEGSTRERALRIKVKVPAPSVLLLRIRAAAP